MLFFVLMMVALVVVGCAKAPVEDETPKPDQTIETVKEPTEEVAETEPSAVSESSSEETVEALSGEIEILGAEGFSPAEASVNVGEEVVFINKINKNAVLTFQKDGTKKFINSNLIKTGATYSHAFSEAGSYTYWDIGYGIEGKLIVG